MASKPKPERKINTQGGAYIEGKVSVTNGDFVAGDQNKLTVNGPVSGSIVTVGSGNVVNTSAPAPASLENLVALVKEMRALLPQTQLEADEKEVIDGDFKVLEEQVTKPEPKKTLVLPKLKSIAEVLGSAVAAGDAISKLIPMVNQAIQWAQQILK